MKILIKFISVFKYCILKTGYGRKINARKIPKLHFSSIITAKGQVTLGTDVSLQTNTHLVVLNGANACIGDSVSFNRNCILICRKEIQIGNHVEFGPNVVIYDHDHVYGGDGIVAGEYKCTPIIIEDNCWIGSNVSILRGTKIGKGSVIGAGCVIKGDVPPHSLVVSENKLRFMPIDTFSE